MEGTETESNEDYGMLFRLSQEGGITYTKLIQQVSVSSNAILPGAQVAGGLPLLQNSCGSFMQLLQAPIESETALYLTSNRFEYDNTFWGFDPHNGYQQNDLQNAQTDTSQICNSLPQSVDVHPPVASLDMLYDEMQKSSADVDNQAEMCRSTVQLKASSVEVIYNEMQTQNIEADACFDQHFEQATEEDLLSDHAIVTFQQVEEIEQDKSAENPNQNFSEEDINIFLENESVTAVQRGGQEANSAHVPSINKVFADENEAFDFYNGYAYMVGFSTCKASNYHSRKTVDGDTAAGSTSEHGAATRHSAAAGRVGSAAAAASKEAATPGTGKRGEREGRW
uniref:Uncharacterized protein n=1 Tax=Oryza sativa subsp. japonica TaxID=39947 RepID=Q8H4B1_ORYSJ|nr:hypothetical protein [Oryza sativa Japonica Group]